MSPEKNEASSLASKQRVEDGLEALRAGLRPYVAKHMQDRHGPHWRQYASRARGDESGGELDVYALLKTLLDQWGDLFRLDATLRKARSFISLALDARKQRRALHGRTWGRARRSAISTRCASFSPPLGPRRRPQSSRGCTRPSARQAGARPPRRRPPLPSMSRPHRNGSALGARSASPTRTCSRRASPMPSSPPILLWSIRVRAAREYGDPAAFFRITYVTEGLQRVLGATMARLAGRGGEPVIGLQTNFGGGKTHTMLALHHLAGAAEAGYRPERLDGMGPLFEAAGVETLGPVRRAVFVGTHKGAAEAMHAENGREIRTLWGYLAWRLGGWEAVDSIADSEAAGTNPGSERLIPILRGAAPCLVLMDEVVAFARQLRGLQYDAFHAFIQSLTEAAAAVERAVVVGSLPESGAEVGDEQGRDALRRLEKIFGRVQSAWTPASGIETFEIVRHRLFQPLDDAGEKARDDTVRAFRRLYRENRADFSGRDPRGGLRGADAPGVPAPPRGAEAFLGRLVGAREVPAHPRRPQDHGERDLCALERGERHTAHHPRPAAVSRQQGADSAPRAAGPCVRADPPIGGRRGAVVGRANRSAAPTLPPRQGGDPRGTGGVLRHRAACGCRARGDGRRRSSPLLRPARRPDCDLRRGSPGDRISLGTSLPRRRPLLVLAPADAQQARRRPGAGRDRRAGGPEDRRDPARGAGEAVRLPPRARRSGKPHRYRRPEGGVARDPAARGGPRSGRWRKVTGGRSSRPRRSRVGGTGSADTATRLSLLLRTARTSRRRARTPGGNGPGNRSWRTPTSGRI